MTIRVYAPGGGPARKIVAISAVGVGHKIRNLVLVPAGLGLDVIDIPAANWTRFTVTKTRKEEEL